MLRKLTDCCQTNFALVSVIKRDAELLLCNNYGPAHTRDYFACGMFYMFKLITVSYCQYYAVAYGHLHS